MRFRDYINESKKHSKKVFYNPKTMKTTDGKVITPKLIKDFGIKGYILIPMYWSNKLEKWVTIPQN
jgi:hypothetical protein